MNGSSETGLLPDILVNEAEALPPETPKTTPRRSPARKQYIFSAIGRVSKLYSKSKSNKKQLQSHEFESETPTEVDFVTKPTSDSSKGKRSQCGENKSSWSKSITDIAIPGLKSLALFSMAWLVGYMSMSIAWIFILAVVVIFSRVQSQTRRERTRLLRAISEDEQTLLSNAIELPSWVLFPDVERAEWINKILYQLWPFIGSIVKSVLKNNVEGQLRQYVPSYLSGLRFDMISLGDVPPRVGGVRTYTSRINRKEIILDLDLIYAGDGKLSLSAKKLVFGIEDVQLRGTMRVILGPLIGEAPLIGGVSFYFLTRPSLDFNLTNLLNALDVPGIYSIMRSLLCDVIATSMVLPNRLAFPLIDDVKSGHLKNPVPEGLLRVSILRGTNLVAKDFSIGSGGSSDPYVRLCVGEQTQQTTVKNATLNPEWNEVFDFFVDDYETGVILLSVHDKDVVKDEFLGSKEIKISDFIKMGTGERYIPLDNIKHGQLKLELVWMKFSDNQEFLTYIKPTSSKKKNFPSSAVCFVYVDSARNLPFACASSASCNPVCRVKVGNETSESSPSFNTRNPSWEHLFKFKLQDFIHREVEISVHDYKKDRLLGSTRIPLSQLVELPSMCIEQPFDLEGSSEHDTTIFASISLRSLIKADRDFTPAQSDFDSSVTALENMISAESQVSEEKGIEQGLTAISSNLKQAVRERSQTLLSDSPVSQAGYGTPRNISPERLLSPLDVWGKPKKQFSLPWRKASNVSIPINKDIQQGEILLTVVYFQDQKRLTVKIHECRDLVAADDQNKDLLTRPYVRIYLFPDRNGDSRFATDVAKGSAHPVFNETKEYFITTSEECEQKSLDVMVKDDLPFFKKPFLTSYGISRTLLHLSEINIDSAQAVWYPLYKVIEQYHEKTA